MNNCSVCGREAELHHIVYRSNCKHMINIDINLKYLCYEHHRGNKGPHLNKEMDLKYKRELQEKLYKLFNEEYVTVEQIKERLKTTNSTANKIVKVLRIYKEGYKNEDVIRSLMGGKIY